MKKGLFNILAVLTLIVVSILMYVNLRGSYLEHLEIGENFKNVFNTKLAERLGIFGVVFTLSYMFISILNVGMIRSLKNRIAEENSAKPEKKRVFIGKLPNVSLAIIISVIFAYMAQNSFAGSVLKLIYPGWFGLKDPILNLDYTVFITVVPIVQGFIKAILGYLVFSLLYITIYNIIAINKYSDGVTLDELKSSNLFKQIINILIIGTILVFIYTILSHQDILVGDMVKGTQLEGMYITGAGFIDINIKLWLLRLVSLMLFVALILLITGIKKNDSKKILYSIVIVPFSIIVMSAILLVSENVIFRANVLDREKPFIAKNIEETKRAFGLDINTNEVEKAKPLELSDIKEDYEMLSKIPIVTDELAVINQGGKNEYEGMYKFNTSTLKETDSGPVYLTPREIDLEKEKTGSDKLLKYTHGNFGILTHASKMDKDGKIDNISEGFKDLKFNGINITEPRLYYGIKTKNTVITNSKAGKEIDYPISLTENNMNEYNGKGGISLGFLDRLVLGIKRFELHAFVNGNLKEDSRLLFNRQVVQRAKTIIPDIKYDKSPYMAVSSDGSLKWIIDGYTMTNRFPYSQKIPVDDEYGGKERINYIKNSIKVIVDAYDGNVKFYLMDKSDPLAINIYNMYKEAFGNPEDIDYSLRNQFIYPQYLFDAQAQAIRIHHNSTAEMIYRADDVWSISQAETGRGSVDSSYALLKNDEATNIGILTTYTPKNKKSVNAYLTGVIEDGSPKLELTRYLQNDNILMKTYIKSQINKDEKVKEEISAVRTLGTEIKRIPMMVPIDETLIYIEPVFQVNVNEETPPVLKKVIVANGNKVAIGNTLLEAISNLFTESVISLNVTESIDRELLINSIITQNKALNKARKDGNLEAVGTETQRLSKLINQLEENIKNEEKKEKKNKDKKNKDKNKNEDIKENNDEESTKLIDEIDKLKLDSE